MYNMAFCGAVLIIITDIFYETMSLIFKQAQQTTKWYKAPDRCLFTKYN